MTKLLLTSLRAIVVLSLLTGLGYPLLVSLVAWTAFPDQATGSLIPKSGPPVGSALIAQKFSSPRYFTPRPSAVEYGTVPSGASNLGATSAALEKAIQERRTALGWEAPVDLLTTSGSGLDPHLTPEGALFQVAQVAQARGLAPSQTQELIALVQSQVEGPQFGFMGRPRVNVLLLNLSLDELFP